MLFQYLARKHWSYLTGVHKTSDSGVSEIHPPTKIMLLSTRQNIDDIFWKSTYYMYLYDVKYNLICD